MLPHEIVWPHEFLSHEIVLNFYLREIIILIIISAPNENSQKASISGPNENSQKASISVNVLAANSQDEVYERTTRPRPESDKQTRILDDEMMIMIRTGSQMENKLHENVSKKVGRPKEHTG